MNKRPISVFAINLKNRTDRRQHFLQQFNNKEEFDVHIVDACRHANGAMGLWKSITYVLQTLVDDEMDYVIICEDDHQFTDDYNKEYLFDSIEKAKEIEADILLGGVSWFTSMIEVSRKLFWVEKFNGAQFTILFRKFFKCILEADFAINDCADLKMGSLTENKFFMHPYISIQKDFGYSDATLENNVIGRVSELFENSVKSISILNQVKGYFENNKRKIQTRQQSYSNIIIPTNIINLPKHTERRRIIENRFAGRKEFAVTITEPCSTESKESWAWLSMKKIIQTAIENDEDVVIVCRENHQFTIDYQRENFINLIGQAGLLGCNVMVGGVEAFNRALPITENIFWIDSFQSSRFFVIYRSFYTNILQEPFSETDTVESKISEMTSNKMVIHPFISEDEDLDEVQTHDGNFTKASSLRAVTADERICELKKAWNKFPINIQSVFVWKIHNPFQSELQEGMSLQ